MTVFCAIDLSQPRKFVKRLYNGDLYINKDNIYYINCKCDVLIKLGKYKECFELTEEVVSVFVNAASAPNQIPESMRAMMEMMKQGGVKRG